MSKKRPFSNGTEFMIFREMNCYKCKKDYDGRTMTDGENPLCDIEQALSFASVTDGMVEEDIYNRMGLGNGWKAWDGYCPEKESEDE